MKLHIIYRLCDKLESVNGLPRPLKMTKKQVIGCCFLSLTKSLCGFDVDWSMTIIADDVSDETSDFVKEVAKSFSLSFIDVSEEVIQNNKIPEYTGQKGQIRWVNFKTPLKNAGSLLKAYEVADQLVDDPNETWVYFCEDDYLHDKISFIPRFIDFIELEKARKFAFPAFYHPTDYPDQYTRLLSRCYIFQSFTGYFREVCSTTGTYICKLGTYKKFSQWIKECIVDDGKFSTIFKKSALCFSPLPGSATHMHDGVMSNYVDWNKIIYDK